MSFWCLNHVTLKITKESSWVNCWRFVLERSLEDPVEPRLKRNERICLSLQQLLRLSLNDEFQRGRLNQKYFPLRSSVSRLLRHTFLPTCSGNCVLTVVWALWVCWMLSVCLLDVSEVIWFFKIWFPSSTGNKGWILVICWWNVWDFHSVNPFFFSTHNKMFKLKIKV